MCFRKKGEISTHEIFNTGEHVQKKLPSARVNCFPGGTVVKDPPTSAGGTRDHGSISGSGRSPGEGKGNPLHYSCLENSMDRGASWATVHRATVAKSWARLSAHTHKLYKPFWYFLALSTMYYFPTAAIMDYHKISGLKQHKFYSLI